MVERWMAYALVGLIVLGETASLRTRAETDRKDQGSYLLFRASLAAGYLAAFALWQARALPAALALGAWAPWAGAALNLGGTILRVWSMRTLGAYFTRAVHVSSDQKIVEDGPYRLVRHPSYTGIALQTLGVALAMSSLFTVALLAVAFAIGVGYRIRVEERALEETLGEPYRAYMLRTKRLIPYVF